MQLLFYIFLFFEINQQQKLISFISEKVDCFTDKRLSDLLGVMCSNGLVMTNLSLLRTEEASEGLEKFMWLGVWGTGISALRCKDK